MENSVVVVVQKFLVNSHCYRQQDKEKKDIFNQMKRNT